MAISVDRLSLLPAWQRFWQWWQEQLQHSLPPGVRNWLFGQRTQLLIALSSEGELKAWQWEAHAHNERTATPLAGEGQVLLKERLLAIMRERQEVSLTLLLLPGQYLLKTLTLPLAAEENLRQVIAFELDRQTPFSPDQVYFTSRVLERLPQSRQLKAELVLTPREFLDAQLASLHQAKLKPQRVDAALWRGQHPLPLGVDLLPPRWRLSESSWHLKLSWALAGLLTLLLLLALALPLLTQYQILTTLNTQLDQVRKKAQATSALQRQVTALEQAARFGVTRKQSTPPMLVVLEDLAQRLPQDTWLTGLSYRDGELRIEGVSKGASKLIEILEGSPFLHNTHFVSPVTQDRNTGLERFQISMNVNYERDAAPK
jgi:general secretion pathway protein L